MIKLLALDIDGTIVNSERKMTTPVKEAILKAQDKGVRIVLCTGRPYEGLEDHIKTLRLDQENHYVITNTGAFIQDSKTGSIHDGVVLDRGNYEELREATKDQKIQLTAYTSDDLWNPHKNPNDASLHDSHILKMPVRLLTEDILTEDFKIARINIMGEKEEVDHAVNSLSPQLLEKYYTIRNEVFSFELLHKNAGKGNALRRLGEMLDIDRKEIMAIGDGNNDIEMIDYAGVGVAMKNATEEVIKVADFITLSNDEDGVAYAIEKFIF